MLVSLICICAYLIGSISSAVLVCQVFGLADPRFAGSNNPGATNVLRLGGKLPAALVLIFDILKGTIPVWGAYFLEIEPVWLGAAPCAITAPPTQGPIAFAVLNAHCTSAPIIAWPSGATSINKD